jgi:DTW domain-containing protein
MSRSVVLASVPRCEACRFALRWCICSGLQAIDCPLEIDVLIHHREYMRPTSTGRLINRVIPASRRHLFRRETPPTREMIALPGKTLWVLHPRGEPLRVAETPSEVQVLLLDASWPEAARMSQVVATWGRLVRLPMRGASRYRLREQQLTGNYSTIESLLFLFAALGLSNEEAKLRLQFELHVYAGLRARGAKVAAAEYLSASPIREAFPDLLQEFDRVRPDARSFKSRE